MGMVKFIMFFPEDVKHSFDEFSDDDKYRFVMGHIWDDKLPKLLSCALNPSVGNSKKNDRTNTRLEKRARRMKLGGVIFVNLFPYIAKNPIDMKKAEDPFGDKIRANDIIIEYAIGNFIICGWGNNGIHLDRNIEVLYLLKKMDVKLYALDLTNSGHPKHPLYVSDKTEPFRWNV